MENVMTSKLMYYISSSSPLVNNLFPSPVWKHQTDKIDNRELEKVIIEKEKKNPVAIRKENNVGGYQSSDIDLKEDKEFKCIYDYIRECMEVILFSTNYKSNLSIVFHRVWVNVNPKGDSNEKHIHCGHYKSDCHWSGIYYIKTHANCGDIRFHNPIPASLLVDHSSFLKDSSNLDSISLNPSEGTLLIFPSWVMHSVDKNKSEYDRISISFDIELGK